MLAIVCNNISSFQKVDLFQYFIFDHYSVFFVLQQFYPFWIIRTLAILTLRPRCFSCSFFFNRKKNKLLLDESNDAEESEEIHLLQVDTSICRRKICSQITRQAATFRPEKCKKAFKVAKVKNAVLRKGKEKIRNCKILILRCPRSLLMLDFACQIIARCSWKLLANAKLKKKGQ